MTITVLNGSWEIEVWPANKSQVPNAVYLQVDLTTSRCPALDSIASPARAAPPGLKPAGKRCQRHAHSKEPHRVPVEQHANKRWRQTNVSSPEATALIRPLKNG